MLHVENRPRPGAPRGDLYAAVARMRDPAVFWMPVTKHASGTFAALTRSLRDAVSDPQSGHPTPDQDPSAWLRHGAAALEQADPLLARSLRIAAASAHPVIVVRGLPAGPVPPVTPHDGVVDQIASCQAIINLHAVLACLGLHPIAYAQENASTLHGVCPVKGAGGKASSRGFDTTLPFHTDYADRPIDEPVTDQSPAAAALAFAVERAEPSVPMQCVPLRRLLAALSKEQIDIGQSEAFAVQAPAIFGDGHPVRTRRLFLTDPDLGIRCRLNLGRMTGLTSRATRLLHEIHEILSDKSRLETIDVRRGDIVVMDNRRVIHRRASFTPRWDGTDRYFIRMSAAPDALAGVAADSHRPWVWS